MSMKASVHVTRSTTKTTERTVNAGKTQKDKRRGLVQGLLEFFTGTTMQETPLDEPMDCTNGDQQGDPTPPLSPSKVSAQDQGKNQEPRPLPQPKGGPRVPGASGQSRDIMAGQLNQGGLPTQGAWDPNNQQETHRHQREDAGRCCQGNGGMQDGHHHTQDQMNVQLQRPLQASKQMAYQVFANVITAIEELEHRECNKKKVKPVPERSKAFIPDQSFKTYDDVVAGVEGQLVVFQSHMRFCPREISEQIKVEMIDTTLTWAAARQDLMLLFGEVDQYALNLLEILYDGATEQTFSILKKSWRFLSRSELMSGFSKIMSGQAKGMELDKQFTENPATEAEALPIRQGTNIAEGILRLMEFAKKQKKLKLVNQFAQHLESIGCAR